MPKLYAVCSEHLPPREYLWSRITLDAKLKEAAWTRMQESEAKDSMGGILLLQMALREHGMMPEHCILDAEPSGRPFLRGVDVDFSISHSGGIVVCAFEFGNGDRPPRVAVDIESRGHDSEESMRRISERWFLPSERKLLNDVFCEEIFLRIWTGKEAIVKWTGEGIGGLKRADTFHQTAEGRKLTCYSFPKAVATLCHMSDSQAPQEIRFFVDR